MRKDPDLILQDLLARNERKVYRVQQEMRTLYGERLELIRRARRRGWSYGRVADNLGVSRQAVMSFVKKYAK